MRHKYYTDIDFHAINNAKNYTELCTIALRVLDRMKGPAVQVCGPIETGGSGKVAENLRLLDLEIEKLATSGIEIFDQIAFEDAIKEMKYARKLRGELGYDYDLLNEFYLPILESGHIKKLLFVNNWRTTKGATWEHEQGLRLGLEINYLD